MPICVESAANLRDSQVQLAKAKLLNQAWHSWHLAKMKKLSRVITS